LFQFNDLRGTTYKGVIKGFFHLGHDSTRAIQVLNKNWKYIYVQKEVC
jgi:hypothetical protein